MKEANVYLVECYPQHLLGNTTTVARHEHLRVVPRVDRMVDEPGTSHLTVDVFILKGFVDLPRDGVQQREENRSGHHWLSMQERLHGDEAEGNRLLVERRQALVAVIAP